MVHQLHTAFHLPRIWLTAIGLTLGLLVGHPASGQAATLNPPYPRIVAHKMGGGWETVDEAEMEIIARHHIAQLALARTWSANGYNVATLSRYLKSLNPNIKLVHAASIIQNGKSSEVGSPDYLIKMKIEAERGAGGKGDWWLRTGSGSNITGFSNSLWRANFTENVMPDARGRKLPQWYFQWLYAKNSDGIDFVTKGTGLREGLWDGLYEDDQYISYGPMAISIGDYDQDGTEDHNWDSDVRTWVTKGHVAFRDAMKAVEPTWLFMANMSTQLHPNETVPTTFQGVNDGGFFERLTFVETTQGWTEMMARYRRGLALLRGPKVGMFHNDINSFRTKYPGSGFSDYRWNRYGMCSALMDNGYYIVTDTTYKRVRWFDEQWGGSLKTVGYLGYPIDPPQTSAWSAGVYKREFENGLVLVNPKGNGERTVNIGAGWKRLSGEQDPVHNNGKVATSITLDDQDGIILVRENMRASPNPPMLLPPE